MIFSRHKPNLKQSDWTTEEKLLPVRVNILKIRKEKTEHQLKNKAKSYRKLKKV